jgi:beta-1,4-mannosyl-glycoprotein beta-1,4-N-acetylglucosaminyltransferase
VIYDLFPFFNELDVLELRLRVLDGVVDRFIAVQAEETHAGQPKPIYLDVAEPRWRPWAGRLSTVVLPPVVGADQTDRPNWTREHAPRHAMAALLADAAPTDLALLADADEIADPHLVAAWAPRVPADGWVTFATACFYYYLNLWTRAGWPCIALAPVGLVRRWGAQRFRYEVRRKHTRFPIPAVPGGWHFSFLGGPEAVHRKLAAFVHADEFGGRWSVAELAHRIATRRDWASAQQFRIVGLDQLPEEVQRHPDRYAAQLLSVEAPCACS